MTKLDVTVSLNKGEFRTFGSYGPTYQIMEIRGLEEPLRIQVVESGEVLDYPVQKAAMDPVAA